MKRITYTAFYILLPFIAIAYSGGKQSTFNNTVEFKELENKANYEYLNDSYESNRQYNEAFVVCSKKNEYYMPTKSGADADGCYDVTGYLDSLAAAGSMPTYAGNVSVANGDLTAISGDKAQGGGFAADYICNANYTGSRTLRAGDIKYLIRQGTLPTLSNVLLFDSVKKIISDGATRYTIYNYVSSAKIEDEPSITAVYSCSGYTSSSYQYKSSVVRTTSSSITYDGYECDTSGYLVCVYD